MSSVPKKSGEQRNKSNFFCSSGSKLNSIIIKCRKMFKLFFENGLTNIFCFDIIYQHRQGEHKVDRLASENMAE